MIVISNILEVQGCLGELKAVVFDLDDTLYCEKEYVRSGFSETAKLFPGIADAEEKLWKYFTAGEPAIDQFLMEEHIFSEGLREKCLEAYRSHRPEIHLYDGVKKMLVTLRKEGFKTGIITDGRPHGQRAKIEALDLENVVDEIIITDELGGVEFRKPNPAAFEQMVKKLQVEYCQSCYVGDNIRKDFTAPKDLGMRCIWFNNPEGIYSSL